MIEKIALPAYARVARRISLPTFDNSLHASFGSKAGQKMDMIGEEDAKAGRDPRDHAALVAEFGWSYELGAEFPGFYAAAYDRKKAEQQRPDGEEGAEDSAPPQQMSEAGVADLIKF